MGAWIVVEWNWLSLEAFCHFVEQGAFVYENLRKIILSAVFGFRVFKRNYGEDDREKY